jgi:hypothetical protein
MFVKKSFSLKSIFSHQPSVINSHSNNWPDLLWREWRNCEDEEYACHLFDFEQVEIIQATDEDVERFAVQVGNDTDPVRQPHYAQMQRFIAPQCQLSENSLRVLQIMFGQVDHETTRRHNRRYDRR